MDDLKRIIATRLKEARTQANFTQAELADLLETNRHTYSNYETGASWIPVERLAKVKEVLDRSVDWLLGSGTSELSNSDLKVLELYRKLSDEDKELVIDFLEMLISRKIKKKQRE